MEEIELKVKIEETKDTRDNLAPADSTIPEEAKFNLNNESNTPIQVIGQIRETNTIIQDKNEIKIAVFDPPKNILCSVSGTSRFNSVYKAFLAMNLINKSDIKKDMVYPMLCSDSDLSQFHTVRYLRALLKKFQSIPEGLELQKNFCIEEDIYELAKLYTSGSLGCANTLCNNSHTFAVNFYGGACFAKKDKTNFCQPINDVILSILTLTQKFTRVLYISLDDIISLVVEEAFYTTNQVYTLSFYHKCRKYIETQVKLEKDNTIPNGEAFKRVQIKDYMCSKDFIEYTTSIITSVYEEYKPEVIVFQASSRLLTSDKSCASNLTTYDIAKVFNFIVSKCRENETKILLLGSSGILISDSARLYTSLFYALQEKEQFDNSMKQNIPNNLENIEYFNGFNKVVTEKGNFDLPIEAEDLTNLIMKEIENKKQETVSTH